MRFVNTKTIFVLLVIGLLLFLIKNIVGSILSLRQNSRIVTTLSQQEADEKKKKQFLKEKLYQVNTPEYIENEAREKLGMVKNGEHVVLAPPTLEKKQKTIAVDLDPNWKKWWKLFF